MVIGNPPYQRGNNNKGVGNTLWNLFVEKSLEKLLVKGGFLVFVHPRGWRQINNKIGNLMKKKQIMYLNMNSVEQGEKVFKCSTDFDFYILENVDTYQDTIINDYKNKEYKCLLKNKQFIPNHSMKQVFQIVCNKKQKNNFLNSKSLYETRRKWMSKEQDNKHRYQCVYSINKNNEPTLRWSSRNDLGHFKTKKFIFSNGSGIIKDYKGNYGLTEWAYSFVCQNNKELNDMEKIFKTNKFQNFINAINLTSDKYNYNIMKCMKPDWYKQFL